jgi:hypothetical protein
MMPAALIDASSAILLEKAGLIRLCCQALTLLMSRAVFDEVTAPQHRAGSRLGTLAGRQPGFGLLDNPVAPLAATVAEDLERLDRGERDTLHHYLSGAARFVIMDDGKGLRACRRHRIPHVNALLCPKLLHYGGHLPKPRQAGLYLERLAGLGRYSADVIAWATACGRSDLEWFLDGMHNGRT